MKIIDLNSTQKKKEVFEVQKNLDLFLVATNSFEYELEVHLNSENSSSNIYVLLLGNQSKTFNLNITSRHNARSTFSRVHVKSVLSNGSILNFEGLIRIESSGLYSDAYLQNDNLLITSDSIVNTSPQLEILADDVKVSHGVTIKDIDEEYKFYLTSRGLSVGQSKGLIIKGFINDLLKRLSVDQRKELLSEDLAFELE